MTKQVNLFPDRAATFVVHPTPGIGDATTIQEALDMLPAEGGSVLVREGTYALAATITLPDKPVEINGCGEGTIVDLGVNAISAFTVPTGLTAFRKYVFEDFKVIGTAVAGQRVVTVSGAAARGAVSLVRLKIDGIIDAVQVTAGDPGFDHAVQVSMEDVWMIPVAGGLSSLLHENMGGAFRMIEFRAVRVRFYDVTFGFEGGSLSSTPFAFSGRVDAYFQDCYLHVDADSVFGSLYMENCSIYDPTGTIKTITSFGSAVGLIRSALIDVDATGYIDFVFNETTSVLGGSYDGPRLLSAVGSSDSCSFIGIEVVYNGTNFLAGCVSALSGNNLIEGCTFDFSSAPATSRYVEIGSGGICTVRGCNFRALPATASCAVGILDPAGLSSISDCMFDQPNVPPYKEFTGGTPMNPVQYHNNFFTTATIDATIIATGSRVDGVQMGDARNTAAAEQVSAIAYGWGRIASVTTEVGNVGTSDLQTFTVLAKALNQSLLLGRMIRVKAWGRTANNANAKTVTLEFGGQTVMTQALPVSVAGTWRIDCEIIKTGPSTQRVFAELLALPTTTQKQTATAGVQTDTADIIIKCTGAGVAANDVVQEGMILETS